MAPELLDSTSDNTAESDVYSFGIMLYEVYSREHPYEDEDYEDVIRDVIDPAIKKRPPVPDNMPAEVASLLYLASLTADPEARLTFVELNGFLKRFKSDNLDPGELDLVGERGQIVSDRALLDEIFPPKVAEALRMGQKVEPEEYDMVTIFFSDVVGFTSLSSVMSPKKVTSMVDRLCGKMDALSVTYGVHKLETIGDVGTVSQTSTRPAPAIT